MNRFMAKTYTEGKLRDLCVHRSLYGRGAGGEGNIRARGLLIIFH